MQAPALPWLLSKKYIPRFKLLIGVYPEFFLDNNLVLCFVGLTPLQVLAVFPMNPANSISQAIPRCTINPPKIVFVR